MKLAKDRDASGVMTQEHWTYTYYVRDAQGNVMATYKRSLTADIDQQLATDKLVLEESHIYGSSRLGIDDRESENISSTNTFAWSGGYDGNGELIPAAVPTQAKMAAVNVLTPKRKLGLKLYELSNHLGNVLVTVSDRKLLKQLGASSSVEYYMADVRSTSDYSAFGAPLAGRNFTSASGKYRYDFNGKETDTESDLQDYGMRIYNARLGKFLSVDPITRSYPMLTPYQFASNTPIMAIDLDGLEMYYAADGTFLGKTGTSTEVRRVDANNVQAVQQHIQTVNQLESKMNFVMVDNGLSFIELTMLNSANTLLLANSTSTGMTFGELNTRAFLTTVRQAENSSTSVVSEEPLAYNINYGGNTFNDYSKHPNKTVTKGGYTSDAAGAYQIMGKTWKSVCVPLGKYKNFTPETQDRAAILLIKEQDKNNPRANGVWSDLTEGKALEAAKKLNGTWTSLPGGSQTKMSDADFNREFRENFINPNYALEKTKGIFVLSAFPHKPSNHSLRFIFRLSLSINFPFLSEKNAAIANTLYLNVDKVC
jgi:RHS repeat-associated protein